MYLYVKEILGLYSVDMCDSFKVSSPDSNCTPFRYTVLRVCKEFEFEVLQTYRLFNSSFSVHGISNLSIHKI
jgi:hypothetical protein